MYINLMRSFFLDFTNVIMSCHLRQFLSDTHAVEVSPVPEDCNMNPLHIVINCFTLSSSMIIVITIVMHFVCPTCETRPPGCSLWGCSTNPDPCCIFVFLFLCFCFFVFFLFAISRSLFSKGKMDNDDDFEWR